MVWYVIKIGELSLLRILNIKVFIEIYKCIDSEVIGTILIFQTLL